MIYLTITKLVTSAAAVEALTHHDEQNKQRTDVFFILFHRHVNINVFQHPTVPSNSQCFNSAGDTGLIHLS